MKPTEPTSCDHQRIDDYLEERLSQGLLDEFERHLSDCERCRAELQNRSADPDMWRDAAALLGSDLTSPDPLQSSARLSEIDGLGSSDQTAAGPKNHRREQYVLSVLDSLSPTDDPEMLGRVGDYEISGVVGVGGMGAVLKGFDKSLRRVVAIKIMAPHLAHSGSARTRFQREARAAAAITHDNVIDIYAVSEAAGLPYLVMPYARGPSLQKRIDEGGPLGVIEVVRIGRQIAAGLSAAHEQGLVHRDIKPANILLSDGIERLWITDFGVARAMDDASMTQTGVIAGTPQYMSPEQARGEAVDHRSDLFSLGSVLYTACTGRPPFRSEAAYGILRRITDSDPRPIREINSDIPPWLCNIIARLLAKHPADRFESAAEVVELLDGCLAHLQQPLQVELPPSLRGEPTSDVARSPLAWDVHRHGPSLEHAPQTKATLQPRQHYTWRGLMMMGSILLAGLLSVVAVQWTEPPNISGHWTGENWQHVSLASVDEASDWYSGTFVDTNGRRGALQLEWSRLQRRYNGRWKVGDSESGQITLRAGENGTIRGALSVDPESQLDPTVPRLIDFAWQPASEEAQQAFQSSTGQAADQSVSIRSPTAGVIVRIADKIQLNARVNKGDFIAEISPEETLSDAERQKALIALQKKSDAATSKIAATQRAVDTAKQIYAAIEAQLQTLETAKYTATGRDRIEVQSDWDAANVALKKAEGEVNKVVTELQLALTERQYLLKEIADLEAKLQEVTRLQILAPVAGKVTFITASGKGSSVTVGDVICRVKPDTTGPDQRVAPAKETKGSIATVEPAAAVEPSPLSAPTIANPIQNFSAFGPASELAKRLRESQDKLTGETTAIETCNNHLTKIKAELLELRDARSRGQGDDAAIRELDQKIVDVEHRVRAKESEIEALNANKKIISADLAEAERERNTILQILQTQLSAAEQQLSFKRKFQETMKLAFQSGQANGLELQQAEQALVAAESEVRQLILLFEFYNSLGSKPE